MKLIVSIFSGAAQGIIFSRYFLLGSGLSLIPWAIVGIAIGYWTKTKQEAIINGLVYGFVLSFIFMLAGYTGSVPVIIRLPFFTLLGLFGSFCGLILSLAGNIIRNKISKDITT